ncbi:hypothetical protein EVB81_248 [Rhizobium phage RHph_I46]|uniref:Uncharacterized protein n=1 Tax=Rhizobium phage RHph_I1_9 TaxID=2509729 RepID=A0A7S5UXS4_9CAUD|nr:hypothetical protein PP936_gp246 [Rhizobium phage RHph_I1_9]QIG69817.1 hypothetical protein EVB81_248 [Rhizobium phage RHph_I46]QIG71098.1 hypothetical protein EVB92_248 [Rhizobium phage RHph_I9]QIG73683.1 hypothetical protein EVC04_246 [Rhizobium phage RHph_I1_9]QIG76437.1 hypothetical protein EVC25_248 [Rhizobium phage RHph_I34]
MSLSSAITDIKEALRKGEKLTASLIEEIASDYSINPKLLERKLQENNINEESERKFVEATKSNLDEKFKQKFEKLCERYNVSKSLRLHPGIIRKGVKYVVICSVQRHYVILSHEDFRVYNCDGRFIDNSEHFNSAELLGEIA